MKYFTILLFTSFCLCQNSPLPDIEKLYSNLKSIEKIIDERQAESILNKGEPSQIITNILSLVDSDLRSLKEIKIHYNYFNLSRDNNGCSKIEVWALTNYALLSDSFKSNVLFNIELVRKRFTTHNNPYEVSLFVRYANVLEAIIKEIK
tara:strand:- start:884 stop:1330 length:447 start_codon:yes stop_codon:yes gene_type:complete